jgi:hypothetical protein
VLVTVYHNRLGPEAIQIMQSTIKEMLEKWWRIAKSKEIKSYNQGAMTAAG